MFSVFGEISLSRNKHRLITNYPKTYYLTKGFFFLLHKSAHDFYDFNNFIISSTCFLDSNISEKTP